MGSDSRRLAADLGYREVALFVAEVLVGLLQVQRQGVVQAGGDAFFAQKLLERIAVIDHDDIQVIDRFGKVGDFCKSNDPGISDSSSS